MQEPPVPIFPHQESTRHTTIRPETAQANTNAGGILFAVGAVIAGWSLVIFRKARTTTVPGKSSVKLVTWGPYRFITVFQRNTQEHPQSSNGWDSLGEAYTKAGQKDVAIQNHEKSLQLNSENENAVDMLKRLKTSN